MCLLSWNVWVFFLILWSSPDTVDLLETFHRSLCTLVCKWTYCPPDGWDAGFWSSIGLEDLLENNFSKIGKDTNKQSYYYVLREFREFRKYSLCVVIFSKHVIYTRVLISLFKLCRAVPCCAVFSRQCDLFPWQPVGRRPHAGRSGGFESGGGNRCRCFSHWCSCRRPRYIILTLVYKLNCKPLKYKMYHQ